jgi:hypothetical protein
VPGPRFGIDGIGIVHDASLPSILTRYYKVSPTFPFVPLHYLPLCFYHKGHKFLSPLIFLYTLLTFTAQSFFLIEMQQYSSAAELLTNLLSEIDSKTKDDDTKRSWYDSRILLTVIVGR